MLRQADVADDFRLESLFIRDNELIVLDAHQRQLLSRELPADYFVPAFSLDYDRDGKQDLLFGSKGSPVPELLVINGRGTVIMRASVADHSERFRSCLPAAAIDNRLYVVVSEMWADDPRGILSLSLPDFRRNWFFHLTCDPTGIAVQYDDEGNEILTVSHRTRDTSKYPSFGKNADRIHQIDNMIRFYRIDRDGNTLQNTELYSPEGASMDGIATFYALGEAETDPLLLIQVPEDPAPGEAFVRLHLVDPVAAVVTESSPRIPGTLARVNAEPYGSDSGISETRYFVRIENGRFSRLVMVSGEGIWGGKVE